MGLFKRKQEQRKALPTFTIQSEEVKKEVEKKNKFSKLFKIEKSKILKYPISEDITQDGLIKTNVHGKEEYSYMLSVQGYNLNGLSQSEYDDVLRRYWAMHKNYLKPFKELYLGYPENTQINQAYINNLVERSDEEMLSFKTTYRQIEQKNILRNEEIRKLKVVENDFKSRQSFIVVYGEDEEKLEENLEDMIDVAGNFLTLRKLNKDEVETVFELLNKSENAKGKTTNTTQEKTAPEQINFNYAKNIPVDGREEAIVVATSLATNVKRGWLLNFITNEKIDFTAIDHSMDLKKDYSKTIENSLEVLKKAYHKSKKDANRDRVDNNYQGLRHKLNDIENNGEVIKLITIRMLVSGKDKATLDKKVEQLCKKLSGLGHKAQVFSNSAFYDWSSRFTSSDIQSNLSFGRKGIERSALATSLGFAHNQTYLHDPTGYFLGRTKTKGGVYFDHTTKAGERRSSGVFVSGTKGSGKSTFLKKQIYTQYLNNDYAYIIDKARETRDIVKLLGGAYVSADGSEGKLNLLQIFPMVTQTKEGNESNETNIHVDPVACFHRHINSLIQYFNSWIDFTKDEGLDIATIMQDFYKDFYEKKGMAWGEFDITTLPNEDYPIFTDLHEYLHSKEEYARNNTAIRLEKMVNNVVQTKRQMFVGHTSIDSMLTNQIVAFDISNLSTGNTADFDIMFNLILTLILSMAQNRGRKEKQAVEDGIISYADATKTQIIIDECHTVFNPNKLMATQFAVEAMREDRKFLYGFTFATQLPETMLPPNADKLGGDAGQAVQNMSNMLGLCQYKIFFRQSDTSVPTLKKFFSDNFKPSDYSEMQNYKVIPNLGSEMILTGTGQRGLEMYFYATPYELNIFKGGA